MASVQSSRGKRYEVLGIGEEPTLHIESEGDRLIKDLSKKQLDTALSLEKQKQSEKEFDRGSGFVPLSIYEAGSSTAKEIQAKTTWAQKFEQLVLNGLTSEEATAVLNGADITFPNSKAELSVRLRRAEEISTILKRINSRENTDERVNISRHEKELALAVKPSSDETKLYAFALSCKNGGSSQKSIVPPQHPINQLNQIHDELFADHNPLQAAKTVLRKRRQLLQSTLPPQGAVFEPTIEKRSKNSNWDKQTVVKNDYDKMRSKKEYTCKRETFYTIKDGEIVELKNKVKDENFQKEKQIDKLMNSGQPFVVPVCLDDSEPKGRPFERISLECINSIPRFKDYDPGQPSKVLYLKNLSRNIEEQDLVQLFSKYQNDNEPRIVYRLMTGKMNGQAFITFFDTERASLALNEMLGTMIKGKPIVIQFGRNS